jgi:hypothetical protein
MKNISALNIVTQVGFDEALIKLFNDLHYKDRSLNLSLFTSSYGINIQNKKFSVLPLYEAKYHKSSFFVWNLLSLELVLEFPNTQKIIYYQNQEIPWADNKNIPYLAWSNIFDNDKVTVITDDPIVNEIFTLTWKPPVFIDNLDSEKLYEIL